MKSAAASLRSKLWPAERLFRRLYPVQVPQANWPGILGKDFDRWQSILKQVPANAPQVLLAPAVGTPAVASLDSVLAVALTLRGMRVRVLLCDKVLPACLYSLLERMPSEKEFVRHGPQRALCDGCADSGRKMFSDLGIPIDSFGDVLGPEDFAACKALARDIPRAQIADYRVGKVGIGEHTMAGAIRFFARGALDAEEHGEEVLRRYFEAALLSYEATNRLFERERFAAASFHHGIYVPQGIIGEVARAHDARVVTWAIAYRKGTFVFSHGDTYHHTMMTEPVSEWQDMDWTPEVEAELMDYLKSRWSGSRDWISYSNDSQVDGGAIFRELGIDPAKPCVGLLTNVLWDAQLHYPENAFPSMLDWLLSTIRYFGSRPDLQLLIRVHPAELTGSVKSRQPVIGEINKVFPTLPPNVFIVPPESKMSTYAMMMACDSVLLYATKTGVELTSFGVPVIVAGEAWIRNKGITTDIQSKAHYEEVLAGLPLRKRLSPEVVQRARRYAYHFFFRRMIPLNVVKDVPPPSWSPYAVAASSLDDLMPGRDPGLDVICDGIIQSRSFVFPAERYVPVPAKLATGG